MSEQPTPEQIAWHSLYFSYQQEARKSDKWPSGSRPIMFEGDAQWRKIKAKELERRRQARPFDFEDLFDLEPLAQAEIGALTNAFAVAVDLLSKGAGGALLGPVSPMLLEVARI